jgi:RNA polymerase sigma-70 factor (ECF subfamily)
MSSEEQENNSNLIERAKTDQYAFEELYNMFFSELYGFVFKRVSHRETAEDIISVSFTKAFIKIDSYEGDVKSFKAWLYKITTNTIIDHYRKNAKRKNVSIDEMGDQLSSPESATRHTEVVLASEQLNISMQKLSRKNQEIAIISRNYLVLSKNQNLSRLDQRQSSFGAGHGALSLSTYA